MDWKEQQRESDLIEAKSTLTQIQAAKILATNNYLGCKILIAGLSIGMSNNAVILPALEHEEQEIQKFLNGEPNEWE